jgi:hypothetical protein
MKCKIKITFRFNNKNRIKYDMIKVVARGEDLQTLNLQFAVPSGLLLSQYQPRFTVQHPECLGLGMWKNYLDQAGLHPSALSSGVANVTGLHDSLSLAIVRSSTALVGPFPVRDSNGHLAFRYTSWPGGITIIMINNGNKNNYTAHTRPKV